MFSCHFSNRIIVDFFRYRSLCLRLLWCNETTVCRIVWQNCFCIESLIDFVFFCCVLLINIFIFHIRNIFFFVWMIVVFYKTLMFEMIKIVDRWNFFDIVDRWNNFPFRDDYLFEKFRIDNLLNAYFCKLKLQFANQKFARSTWRSIFCRLIRMISRLLRSWKIDYA